MSSLDRKGKDQTHKLKYMGFDRAHMDYVVKKPCQDKRVLRATIRVEKCTTGYMIVAQKIDNGRERFLL